MSDRLEDQLTGDFFGSIRYLPFEQGLRRVLDAVHFQDGSHPSASLWPLLLDSIRGYDCRMEFWFRHAEGEIDLILNHPNVLIGIEVKYYSGISSDDDNPEDVSPEESGHQLARYSRLLDDIRGGRPAYLIFLAPFQQQLPVEREMARRPRMTPGISLGFLAWQHALEQLQSIDVTSLDQASQLIVTDLQALLLKKGFARFNGFTAAIQHLTIERHAYRFKAASTRNHTLNWSVNASIGEEHYVYNP